MPLYGSNLLSSTGFSTIRDAGLILVMNHGAIIEQGTHQELLAKKGFYENPYNSRFAHGNI